MMRLQAVIQFQSFHSRTLKLEWTRPKLQLEQPLDSVDVAVENAVLEATDFSDTEDDEDERVTVSTKSAAVSSTNMLISIPSKSFDMDSAINIDCISPLPRVGAEDHLTAL